MGLIVMESSMLKMLAVVCYHVTYKVTSPRLYIILAKVLRSHSLYLQTPAPLWRIRPQERHRQVLPS